MPVHDFFKPRREVEMKTVVENVLDLAEEAGEPKKEGLVDKILAILPKSSKKDDIMFESHTLKIHKDTLFLMVLFQTDVILNQSRLLSSISDRRQSTREDMIQKMTKS